MWTLRKILWMDRTTNQEVLDRKNNQKEVAHVFVKKSQIMVPFQFY